MEKSLGSGSGEKTALIQMMTRHIMEKPRDAVMGHDKFSAMMTVLGKTIGDKSAEVSYVSMICFRVVVKSWFGGGDGEEGGEGQGQESKARVENTAPLASKPSGKALIENSLFEVVPALLKRLSTRNTSKELKQNAVKW